MSKSELLGPFSKNKQILRYIISALRNFQWVLLNCDAHVYSVTQHLVH